MPEKKPYVICIEEILRRHIIIRASDEQEALKIADILYTDKGEIVLMQMIILITTLCVKV